MGTAFRTRRHRDQELEPDGVVELRLLDLEQPKQVELFEDQSHARRREHPAVDVQITGSGLCSFEELLGFFERVHELNRTVRALRPRDVLPVSGGIGYVVEDSSGSVPSSVVEMSLNHVTSGLQRPEDVKTESFVRNEEEERAVRLEQRLALPEKSERI